MNKRGPIINEEGLRTLGRNVSRISQGILLVVGFVSVVFSLAGEYSHGEHYLQSWLIQNFPIMGALLHLMLVLLVLFPGRIRKLNDDVRDRTVRSVTKCLNTFFIPAWSWIWVFFGLLYTVYLFMNLHPETSHAVLMDRHAYKSVIRAAAYMDVLNVGSTFCILLTYLFLAPGFLRDYEEARARRVDERKKGLPPPRWYLDKTRSVVAWPLPMIFLVLMGIFLVGIIWRRATLIGGED
ncbi:MAG: hypothetical protein WAU70_17730, partial [Flavobacteriales bacterium]